MERFLLYMARIKEERSAHLGIYVLYGGALDHIIDAESVSETQSWTDSQTYCH